MRRAIGQWLPEGNSTVLDLGCATGRVLRHVLLQEPRADLFAADLNSRHIQWLSRHIKCDRIKPFQNSVLPNLPLPDSTLDLVYAFSVFTHIDSFELGWLAELRRILKPGGIAYITIHSEHTWESMDPAWSLYRNLVGQSMAGGHAVDEATFEKPMPSERVVMRWRRSGSYNCNVFHHSAYVYDLWGRFLEVQDIIRRGSDYQDVVVLRRT
jgi:SAM-dependent methyltransferase